MNARNEGPDWLFDGTGLPSEAEREIVESLRAARWSGDGEALADRAQGGAGHEVSASGGSLRVEPARRRLLGGAILVAAAVLVGVNLWAFVFRADPLWRRAAGGGWSVGQWLETGEAESVEVASSIGRVTVGPDSRVRLTRAEKREHRLELAEGSIEALIFAPPKLFFVDTPGATAVDMGCAYKLDVAADGSGLLRVSGGWVELQAEPLTSRVPAGAVCRIAPGGGPGLPRFEDASGAFVAALDRFEGGEAGALGSVLELARARDSLTVWHLLMRTEGEARERVADRLTAIVPAPEAGVEAGARSLDAGALEAWWSGVRRSW